MSINTKKKILMFMAFAVPVLLTLAAFVIKGIYPFGRYMFLRTDLYHQYAPFTAEMLNKLQSGGSLAWSWNIGDGTNFVALFAYYLADPFNWLLRFIPRGFVIEFITYLVVAKIGLCGLSFYIFLKGHSDSSDRHLAVILPFSWAYAMSAFIVAYSWNIMWMNSIILAPLVLLGIERLVKRDKPLLYCAALTLSILFNYYIAIMLCIFAVLYFIAQIIILPTTKYSKKLDENGNAIVNEEGKVLCKKTKIRHNYAVKTIRFIVYSGLAGGMSAVLIIPEYLALQATASASSSFPSNISFYFNIFQVIARHCVAVTTEQALDHWPNIYCGAAVLLTAVMFFVCKKITFKKKIVYGLFILLLLFSFSVNVLNYIWHGFHYPNSLPCRQSFLYIALILVMGYEAVLKIRQINTKALIVSAAGVLAFLGIVIAKIDIDETSKIAVVATMGLIAVFALIFIGFRKRILSKRTALIMASVTLAIELTANFAITGLPSNDRASYLDYYSEYTSLLEDAEDYALDNPLSDSDSQTPFYRVEKSQQNRVTRNDGAWLNFRSASVFSSVSNANVGEFYSKYGMDHSTNAYSANGMTPYMQAILGVRFLMTRNNELANSLAYESVSTDGDMNLYVNTGAQTLGYAVTNEQYADLSTIDGSPIVCQTQLIYTLTGQTEAFIDVPESSEAGTYIIGSPGLVYAYVTDSNIDDVTAVNGDDIRSFSKVKRGYLLDLGYADVGDQIRLTTNDGTPVSADVVAVNDETFKSAMNTLSENDWQIETFEDTYVKGVINSASDGYLITSIPYDSGWSVSVDNVEIDSDELADCALDGAWFCVPVTEGSHTIEFTYHTPGLKAGAAASAVSLLILLVLVYFRQRLNKKNSEVLR